MVVVSGLGFGAERSVPTRGEIQCMRDVKEEHSLVHVPSAFLRANDASDKRERSEFPQ